MTAEEFIRTWKLSTLGERQAAQPHFTQLCRLLGEPAPGDPGTDEATYCFEKGAIKTSGRRGFADVWKRGHFAWEYKGKGANLQDALTQLQQYALALESPPLLVVCDLERFLIVTNWTNTVSERHELRLEDLAQPAKLDRLRWVMTEPERLRPGTTRQQITERVARDFAALARDLRAKGHHPEAVARFVIRLVFCMFAQNIGLLPKDMLTRTLQEAHLTPDESEDLATELFRKMATGGRFGVERVLHFDGGLFEVEAGERLALPIDRPQIKAALEAAGQSWAEIDPSILGTLFVQGLDPKRMEDLFRVAGTSDTAAVTFRRRFEQYTDADKIMRIIDPVIARPLAREWDEAKARIEALLLLNGDGRAKPKAVQEADAVYMAFLDRIRRFTVLDPACGSGNFLFLALQTLKDIEWRAILDAQQYGLHPEIALVGPEQMLGIDINPFAVELARAAVWIGELQWLRRQGQTIRREPVLRRLELVACRDALLDDDRAEAAWPDADVIVGNPPFLGGKRLRSELGDAAVDRMFAAFDGRVAREADLVCYWFEKARAMVKDGRAARAGLVATNSIRGGANREVLDRIRDGLVIFDAWDDEEWTVEGAAIRVSLIAFARPDDPAATTIAFDGDTVDEVFSDLTPRRPSGGLDLTKVVRLKENAGVAFMGDTKGGAFDIPGELAREWLLSPSNPNGRPNSDVLRPWWNGLDLTRRPRDMWIIDFGWEMNQTQAALYEQPFYYIRRNVWHKRQSNNRELYKKYWWRHVEPRPGMWKSLLGLSKYPATPTVAQHRLFRWLPFPTCADHQLIVVARDDHATFGILHSRFHELWSLRLCTWLGVGNDARYTPSTTFETFPFPEELTPNSASAAYATDQRAIAISTAAANLDGLRERWLNPPDWVRREPEVVPGYPDRLLPVDAAAALELKKRTLTNLYNQRPQWLDDAHRALDEAVAAAYGWPADLSDEEILKRLLDLNRERAAAGR